MAANEIILNLVIIFSCLFIHCSSSVADGVGQTESTAVTTGTNQLTSSNSTDQFSPTIFAPLKSPLRIGGSFFLGRRYDSKEQMLNMTKSHQQPHDPVFLQLNCNSYIVGQVLTVRDTPMNRIAFAKGEVFPNSDVPRKMFTMDELHETPNDGRLFSIIMPSSDELVEKHNKGDIYFPFNHVRRNH
ncbi:hypothetical protein DCAR_0104421 [Daucus carota subsp. sativus]|uniref:Uncharacterized protein n=1 Tax=Daucus carota subsp. sativus TaxID=79200 RepID=A0A166ITY4_DAUCS|nr:PREDICTED: uncharacterized protein LOC108198442 [Daucus carota subsp. sativus]WOG85233.1 hypothetical protein DCAR_0104421 [Daucus carota subsp. sativus]